MRTLAEKIKAAFGKNPTITIARIDHPNFWMYQ